MNGIHDLGGMQGFGPIEREENEPVFHADWERRIFALLNLTIAAGQYHVDEIRHSIERMAPADYLTTPYYVHWLPCGGRPPRQEGGGNPCGACAAHG